MLGFSTTIQVCIVYVVIENIRTYPVAILTEQKCMLFKGQQSNSLCASNIKVLDVAIVQRNQNWGQNWPILQVNSQNSSGHHVSPI